MRGLTVFVVIVVLGGLAASDASAHVFKSTSISGTTFLTGEDEVANEFSTPAGAFTCTGSSLKGQYAGTEAIDLRMHPTLSGCSHSILGTIEVDTTGCDYLFKSATDENGMAAVEIVCEAGKAITIKTSLGCDLKIGEQTIPSAVSYKNVGASPKEEVTVTNTTEKIKYTKVSTSFGACVFIGGNGADGRYLGPVAIRGYSNGAHTQQVNVTVTK